jgi:hypothetical protein
MFAGDPLPSFFERHARFTRIGFSETTPQLRQPSVFPLCLGKVFPRRLKRFVKSFSQLESLLVRELQHLVD